jgi:hypothetical protein
LAALTWSFPQPRRSHAARRVSHSENRKPRFSGAFRWLAVLGSNQAPPLTTPIDRSGQCGRIPLQYRRCDRSAYDKCGHAGHSLRAAAWTKRGRNGATSRDLQSSHSFSRPAQPTCGTIRHRVERYRYRLRDTTGDDLGTVEHPVHV